jgi:alkylhydroperoxidase family enzyme
MTTLPYSMFKVAQQLNAEIMDSTDESGKMACAIKYIAAAIGFADEDDIDQMDAEEALMRIAAECGSEQCFSNYFAEYFEDPAGL